LLVEDEDAVRSVAARVLLNQGYTVIQAHNGAEALKVLDEMGQNIDLILTDVVMPDMGGLALAEQLRSRWPDLKLVYMSGYAEGDKLQPGNREFQTSFLQKPFSAESLAFKVRDVLDAKPGASA
jgi:two-component system cell cycle sensor histidine kinase/response regulator CckA